MKKSIILSCDSIPKPIKRLLLLEKCIYRIYMYDKHIFKDIHSTVTIKIKLYCMHGFEINLKSMNVCI